MEYFDMRLNQLGSFANASAFPQATEHEEQLRLLAEFRFVAVAVRIPGAVELLSSPAHIGKIRGALGEALMETASPAVRAGGRCIWDPPCAYAVLWQPEGELRPGKPMPAPYVIETDAFGNDLVITLKLAGMAGDYLGEVGDALLRALRRGLSIRGPKRLEPADRTYAEHVGLRDPEIDSQATLEFQTPLLLRNAGEAHIEPSAVLRTMIHRADGLARWCGIQLDVDFPALLEATKQVEGDWTEVDVRNWQRGAIHQRRVIPMEGALGRLHLTGNLAPFSPFVALTEAFHCGSRTAWGQGRFRIVHAA